MKASHYDPWARKPRRRAVMWLGTLSLLLSLFSPLISLQAASALDQEPECEPGYVYDPTADECVVDTGGEPPSCPEGETWNPDAEECQPEHQDQDPVGIELTKYDCEGVADAASYGVEQLTNECSPGSEPVTFYQGGDGVSETSTPVTGSYTWENLPAGQHYIYEEIPDGYGEPRVFCGVYYPGQGQSSASLNEATVTNGNAVGWTLQPGEYVQCFWFNILDAYGEIHITKYDCSDYAANGAGNDWETYLDECTATHPDVEFQLWQGQSQIDSQTTDHGGEAHFDQAPTGQLRLAEVLPEGYDYALVFCDDTPIAEMNGVNLFEYSPVQLQEGSYFDFTLSDYAWLDCLWFNFVEETGVDPTEEPTEEPGASTDPTEEPTEEPGIESDPTEEPTDGQNWIDFYKYVCPWGTNPTGEKAYYETECEAYEGWEFNVGWASGGVTETTNSEGYASWSGVPEGAWSASETPQEGWGDPLVWCRVVEWPEHYQGGDEWTLVVLTDWGFAGSFDSTGYRVECHWYNFEPEHEGGNWIDFYKYTCPYDLRQTLDADLLLTECEAEEGWEFDVQWEGGGSTGTTDSDGKASWSGVPQGAWTASETLDEGWAQPVVQCVWADWPDEAGYSRTSPEPFSFQGSPDTIGGEFEYDGLRLLCYWFNFEPEHEGGNWVDFYKYTCPYDLYEGGGSVEYWLEECAPYEDGWLVGAQWSGGQSDGETDGNGYFSITGVPAGEWLGAEEARDGWAAPYVYCRYVEWPEEAQYDSDWVQVFPEENGLWGFDWEFEYDSGLRFECYWFNFPLDDDHNWVDFYKYVCPWGTTPGGEKAYYEAECDAYEGWDYNIGWASGEFVGTTDEQGFVGWSGVPEGQWSAGETPQGGWGDPLVWCRYVEWPDGYAGNDEWFPVTVSNWGIEHTFEGTGFRIECHWYNFEPEHDYVWVDFYKYSCPWDTILDGEVDYYLEECEAYDGWEFNAEWEGGSAPATTDDTGHAGWTELPTTGWSASESIPSGWGEPLIWCRYVEWPDEAGYDNNWFPVQHASGQVTWGEEVAGVRIECYWFNFEPEDGGYNWIEFYKYVCAWEVPHDAAYDYYVENCEPVRDWSFHLQYDGGSDEQTTDDAGYTSWSDIPLGAWTASERLAPGWGEPLIWCQYVEWPEEASHTTEWTPYTFENGGIQGHFPDDGYRIVCYWFNFEPEHGNQVDIYKVWCAEQVDYTAELDALLEECTYSDEPARFTLTQDGSNTTGDTTGQTPATWEGVPAGPWTVTEDQYEGWGEPVIWCQLIAWPEGAEGYSEEAFRPEADGWSMSYEFEYEEGVHLACVFFNVEYQDNWIDLTKWWCPEDVALPYESPVDNLYESCTRYTEGVDFTLEYTGGSEPKTTDGEGETSWSEVPGGQWSLHETVPEGYGTPVVWCRYVEWPEHAGLSGDPFKLDAPNGSFSGSFDWSGVRIHCDVFNIPHYDHGWITVYKWVCPEGVSWDSDAEYLLEWCEIVTTGIDFQLSYGTTSDTKKTDSEGKTEWGDVPVGSWTLSETTTTDYGTPKVYCQWVSWPEDTPGTYSQDLFQAEAEQGSITGTHEYPGLRLACFWFNFWDEYDDHWIIYYKYHCEPGSHYGENLEDWLENCDEPYNHATFTLYQGDASSPKTTTGGMAEWTGVNDGDYYVQESLPSGYEEPVVWCYRAEYTFGEEQLAPSPADFQQVTATGGRIDDSLEGGPWRIVCYWFNIPGDDSSITVYKYNCDHKPVGYNTLWQWQEACTAQGNGIEFTLWNAEGTDAKTTADGKAEWAPVTLGQFTITESPYPGFGDPVVWCGWTAYHDGVVYDSFPQKVETPGGVHSGEISVPGTSYFCYWFNIPDDKSKIVVYKYDCPVGVQIPDTLQGHQLNCTEKGDGIEFSLENSKGTTTKAIAGGSATWYDVPSGQFTLTEHIPFGYGEPVWWCGYAGFQDGQLYQGFPQKVNAPEGVYTGSIDYEVTYYYCWVFNFPDYEREITVYKWYCPADISPDSLDYQGWREQCETSAQHVTFNLASDADSWWKNTNWNGRASWYGVPPAGYTLTEQHLPGYEEPYVYCSLEANYEDGAAYAEGYTSYQVTNRGVTKDLGEYAGFKWICHFFNIEKGPGEITVYKWYCPPGYDVTAWGANPQEDCTQAQNGVPFILDPPVGPNVQQNTGASVDGAVYYGDLSPGLYVLSETVPLDVDYVFVWDCVGNDIPKVHPNPLTWGHVLNVQVAGGDSIVCNWYNVPEPTDGWITVHKYQCWSKTWTSEVDCEIFEFGASLDVYAVPGETSMGTGTTNAGGTYTWEGLESGSYGLDEISHTPCKITSTKVDEQGNIWVDAGQGTIVKVYNCSENGKTPGGKVPTKYPNTGVEGEGVQLSQLFPSSDDDDEAEPTEEPQADDEQVDEIGPDDPEATETPLTEEELAAEFYAIACLNVEGGEGAGTPEGETAETGETTSSLPPFLQQPTTQQPDSPDVEDDEADAETGDEEAECVRGSVPQRMVINAANVDHEIEILEIVDGVMQAPTGPEMVSWYKETARLGEANNVVIAGHVNWWGIPQGPFYHLVDLAEGDRIEIVGEDGATYVYEVQWVSQESNLEAPNPEVVGPTSEPSLTLITCGGEWDPAISEYNERTVVRAVQVEVIAPETTGTGEEEEQSASWAAPVAFAREMPLAA